MDTTSILNILQELVFLLATFGIFLVYAIARGRQAVINLTFGLYLALLISLKFPYYDEFLPNGTSEYTLAIVKVGIFAVFTLLATMLSSRVMPTSFKEKKFESFLKKILLAIGATVLIMIYSFHVLPVTEIIHTGTPIQSLFAAKEYFFWWLLLPFAFLYFN